MASRHAPVAMTPYAVSQSVTTCNKRSGPYRVGEDGDSVCSPGAASEEEEDAPR